MSTEVFQIVPQPSFHGETPIKRSGRTKRVYRCKHCARQFKRSEHCARHERVHTHERPFPCSFCDRRYARKSVFSNCYAEDVANFSLRDLVKRHERSLHAEEYQAAHPTEFQKRPFNSEKDHTTTPEGFRVKPLTQQKLSASMERSEPSQSPSSPLTPPNENLAIGLNEPLDSLHTHPKTMTPPMYGINEAFFPHERQCPLDQYSPLASPTEQGQDTVLSIPPGNPFETFVGIDYDPIHLPPDLKVVTQCVDDASQSSYTQPRIDVDPFLLLDDGQRLQEIAVVESRRKVGLQMDEHLRDQSRPSHISHEPTTLRNSIPSPHLSSISPGPLTLFGIDDPWPLFVLEQGHDYMEHSPRVQREQCSELPKYTFDEWIHQKICEDAYTRTPVGDATAALLPSINDLNSFFSGYVECFHRHFPIVHLPSFDLTETPSPLIFAICSIGAQYRLDRRKAKNLFALAGTMSSYALRAGLPIATGTPKPAPIWVMQTRVLLSLCGIFSGLRRSLLSTPQESQLDWEEWISRESSKRLLCGMFIVSNLISTSFGINPGFSHTQDLEFEVLDEEKLWNARSAQEWMELRGTQSAPIGITVRDAMADLVFTDQPENQTQPYHISGFTMLLITHAVNIHMWSLLQFTDVSRLHYSDKSPSSGIHTALLASAFSTLSRCHQVIISVRGGENHSTTWSDTEGPLMFNCQALLRIAHIRLFTDIRAFNRLTLLTDNPEDILRAVKEYAEAPQQRSANLTKAIMKAYEGFLAPIKIGHLLVRKTAALSWSIEHAVAGWDAALLLTKWVHTIETEALILPPDAEEDCILGGLKGLLVEVESDYDGSGSLAAAIARIWSSFLSDVWVWGVTPRMGNILQQLALAYENRFHP
ncbi:uncharacterized protein BDR25DRAFT_376857 [Lindgomyces ingoldianus]|uniref:Uncharacterized protein n=1 Tax=Lindgomyces ingoldianus TaxID=673940 RepID=A0ACB6QIG4_9PLEO|nr:uncharacterized protein BDR25DRAFT_376857 [Lindgomyces ingoldianus]KAF2466726.1 hypothetical protein BDR25DRAFT_376857 [Lindgomyces ingoldianus]